MWIERMWVKSAVPKIAVSPAEGMNYHSWRVFPRCRDANLRTCGYFSSAPLWWDLEQAVDLASVPYMPGDLVSGEVSRQVASWSSDS
jgi:hypothetical protein